MKRFTLLLFIISCFSINGQKHLKLIQDFVLNQNEQNEWRPIDISNLIITDESYSKRSDVHHIYINQSFGGIEIINSGGNFAVKNNEVIYSNLQMISGLDRKINTTEYTVDAKQAIHYALSEIGITNKEELTLISSIEKHKLAFEQH